MDNSEIGQLLHGDHLRTLAAMNALEARIMGKGKNTPLSRQRDEDRTLAESIVALIEREVNHHFRFEEDALFSAVEGKGGKEMTAMLIREHKAIRPLAERVRALAARSLDEDLDASSWGEFRDAAMDLIQSVLFHIQKEEMGLLKQMPFLIDPDVDRALAGRYRSAG